MTRLCLLLALALGFILPRIAAAQDGPLVRDDGPAISITSPDVGSTFVFGELKQRSLIWNKHTKMLVARVTFTDSELSDNTPQDDSLEFRLPGVAFDEARGLFTATAPNGEVIPVARIKRQLFIKSIEVLPNARVRVIHQRGTVTVILEAISPNDPAMHPAPANPDGEHQVDVNKILN